MARKLSSSKGTRTTGNDNHVTLSIPSRALPKMGIEWKKKKELLTSLPDRYSAGPKQGKDEWYILFDKKIRFQ